MTERLHFDFLLSCIGEGNGNPLQCSCLENPRDGGAWWVPQSRARLKRLSSSNSSKSKCFTESPSEEYLTAVLALGVPGPSLFLVTFAGSSSPQDDGFKPVFLFSNPSDISNWMILCCEVCLVYGRMFSDIHGLYPLDASSIKLWHLKYLCIAVSPRRQNHPHYHPPLRTTASGRPYIICFRPEYVKP